MTTTITCVSVPGNPQDVKVTTINSTSIHVSWKPPAEKDRNGIIRGYHVHIQETKEEVKYTVEFSVMVVHTCDLLIIQFNFQGKGLLNDPLTLDVSDGQALELNVTGLQPDTKYNVQVAALTRKGDGDRSPPVTIKTPGGVPNRPTVNLKLVIVLQELCQHVTSNNKRSIHFFLQSNGARASC